MLSHVAERVLQDVTAFLTHLELFNNNSRMLYFKKMTRSLPMLKEFESHTGTASKGAAIGVATFRKHVRSMVKTTLDPAPTEGNGNASGSHVAF